MVVWIFSVKKAREFLLENGYVYTVRGHLKKQGKGWFTDKRGGKKIGDCWALLVKTIYDPTFEKYKLRGILANYVMHSGFDSVEEWIEEIKRVNHGKIPDTVYLYYVALKPI